MLRPLLQRSSRRMMIMRSTPCRFYTQGAPKPEPSQGGPSIPAMLAVASMGFAAYYTWKTTQNGDPIVKFDKPAQSPSPQNQDNAIKPIPTFKSNEVTVVFVLGGPGAGKGTQCENLKKDYGFIHLSAGDLLREEQKRPGSKYGELINHYIKEGLIVPMEVTIALLEQSMKTEVSKGNTRFLIDGFPRKMDQALKFEEVVVPSKMVLYFECPENVMLQRLLKRGESSGRVDDNIESIKKRFAVFKGQSFPVIELYEKQGKVKTVSCESSVDEVYARVREIFDNLFAEEKKST